MVKKSTKNAAHHVPAQNPTLIDVARIAGVSPITVSRALNRPELVSTAAQEKVFAAVRATGYVPNMLAGGLATNKSRLIAIFVPTIANSIFADTVQALMDSLTAEGYQTLLGLTGYSSEREEQLLDAILGRRPDGIVLAGTLHTDESREKLCKAGIPVVEIWDLSASPIDMQIGFSHEQVGIDVAVHLFRQGYRRFSLLSLDDARGLRRGRSVIAELSALGVHDVPIEIMPAPATLLTGREGLARILAQGRSPEVIVCSSDTIAEGVLAEAASRGIRVPQELAVMGFGDLSSAAQVFPALSTVRVDGARIGLLVAQALLVRFSGKSPDPAPVRIDTGFSIIDRATTKLL
ncbi:LacI family DNA-binding transcriptional regulator [Acerihabitans arboris]|uniref:LacI family DNA-binding transcriptional regulator n=1 Tax=Acerihabitans arboris TaxID=2691583 RepID=A0A845SHP4_9GAMM|nr:LacI family DNA-binding transcriptional regulator [Acerihabitans arboris]NDL63399.1 LacI family DNA-binding transcriptional regulator [Acerihabitans arboris]